MGEIIEIKPNTNIPEALRAIADEIENGDYAPESVTLIGIPDIFQLGTFNDNDAATETVFNCNFAIHKLMTAAMDIGS